MPDSWEEALDQDGNIKESWDMSSEEEEVETSEKPGRIPYGIVTLVCELSCVSQQME